MSIPVSDIGQAGASWTSTCCPRSTPPTGRKPTSSRTRKKFVSFLCGHTRSCDARDYTESCIDDRAAARPGGGAGGRYRVHVPRSWGARTARSLTWARIDARSRAIGAVLASHSEPGARVLILLPPSVDFVPAFFGVLYAGAIAIPTYPPSSARADRSSTRLRGMIADAGVTLVLSSTAVHERVSPLQALVPELSGLRWVDVEEVPDEAARQLAAAVRRRRQRGAAAVHVRFHCDTPRSRRHTRQPAG